MKRFTITAANNSLPTLFHHNKDSGIPKKLVAAVYACSDATCGEVIVGNHSTTFSCPSCKADMAAGKTTNVVAADLANAKKVGECAFCACTLISAANALPNFEDGKFYCPVCVETVASLLKADDMAAPPTTDNEDDPEQPDMGPDADTTSEDDSENSEEDPSADSEDDTPSEDDDTPADGDDADAGDQTTTADDGASKDGADSDAPSGDAGTDESEDDPTKSSDDDDPTKSSADSEDDKPAAGDEAADVGGSKNDDAIEASLLAAVGDKEVNIDLISTADRRKWYLMADSVPVAVAEKGRASEGVREHFDTDKYAAAYHAAAKDGVTEDLLKEFGFIPVVTKVPVDEAVRQTVEAQVAEKARAYNLNSADYNERMTRCFGLAALGMVKGTFKDKNPVQDALVASLHRVGVQDAAHIVASSFEMHTPSLFKTLMLRADELMQKEDSNLGDIAKIVEEQPLPSERAPKKGLPPAAMAVLEEERIDRAVKEVSASDTAKTGGYDDIFQRRRAARG